ncbi:MAG: hypothetical protein ABI400_00620 [Lacisediminihabitans sp.]
MGSSPTGGTEVKGPNFATASTGLSETALWADPPGVFTITRGHHPKEAVGAVWRIRVFKVIHEHESTPNRAE